MRCRLSANGGFWALLLAVAALTVMMFATRSGLRTWSATGGLTVGVGQGCIYLGRVPSLAGKGGADWAGIYPQWRFRWHRYPEGGWGLFVPIWAPLAGAAVGAAITARNSLIARKRGRESPQHRRQAG